MSFLARLFGRAPKKKAARSSTHAHSEARSHSQPSSQYAHSTTTASRSPAGSQNAVRKDLLRTMLRETLQHNGIPMAWVGADLLVTTGPGREPGVHVRLLLKHWDVRLLTHGFALQEALCHRVVAFDPLAEKWLMGVSWQFALPDTSVCPALPHPGSWTSTPRPAQAGEEPAASSDLLGGSILISGPDAATSNAANAPTGAHADLERIFAERDEEIRRQGEAAGPDAFKPTEPAKL